MKSIREMSFHYQPGVEQARTYVLEQLLSSKATVELHLDGYGLLLTGLDRACCFVEDGKKQITKREYLRYLAELSPLILRHIKDRPLALARRTEGAGGEWFFYKHWNGQLPPYVETVAIYSEQSRFDRIYLMCNNMATLLWLGETAHLELHAWPSRISVGSDAGHLSRSFTASLARLNRSVLNYPDFLTFELDPFFFSTGKPVGETSDREAYRKCCEIALRLREILEALSLPSYVKTSGRNGLHIFVPILRNMDFPHVRAAAAAIAWTLLQDYPLDITTEWSVARQTSRVLLDYNQNALGKTLQWAYSPSADSEAAVSTPISWEELEWIDPWELTVDSVRERVRAHGDPWETIMDDKADLSHLYLLGE